MNHRIQEKKGEKEILFIFVQEVELDLQLKLFKKHIKIRVRGLGWYPNS